MCAFFALQLFLHIQDIKGNMFSLKEVVHVLEFLEHVQSAFVLSQFILFCPFVFVYRLSCFFFFCKSGLMLKAIYRTE